MRLTERMSLALTIALLSGCGSMDVLAKKQMETEGRLEQVLQASAEQRAQISELSRELQAIEQKVAGLETGNAMFRNEMDAMRERLSAAAAKPEQQLNAPSTIEVVNIEQVRSDGESVQQEAYMKAFGIFSSNRYQEAITAFTSFIVSYPGSEYAANAQYWIGECHYSQKDYQKALEAFNTVLSRYPKGKKAPDAMLKVAFSQLSLNNQSSARASMQKLIESYPKSPAAAKAKERLIRP